MTPHTESDPSATATESTASERVADRARIEGLDVRIKGMETQILELQHAVGAPQQEKDSVQGHLDAYRYPVLTLPNEIMSEIFVHFLPVYPYRSPLIGPRSPALLAQICRKWRDIALSTPELWRAVKLTLYKKRRFEQQLHLLESYLERSGSCPLSIELWSNFSDLDPPTWELPFLRTIARHCEFYITDSHLVPKAMYRTALPSVASVIFDGKLDLDDLDGMLFGQWDYDNEDGSGDSDSEIGSEGDEESSNESD
ncbi:hypothetical protein B0H17DRAFT_1193807 [Mycena rosella]|uniref:F-box domain-containing protein n=1 Tax=Mycena rosella TaxID=1033263 RepID=A0AAD7M7H8_MYCRO|nr:hypothetical protein B0H17DRAFT_1193807 [Mycena rosella]